MRKSKTFLEQLCHSLGKNNDASYAVVAVATAKGIFRPMFTMMDKHEDYETKKYTALREGLTEAIAIPCYLSVAWAAKNLVAPTICKSKTSDQVKKAAKTLSFLGVCTAALVIIPAACSAMINPIMKFLKEKKNHKKCCLEHHLDIKETPTQLPTLAMQPLSSTSGQLSKTYAAFNPMKLNTGLTIGGSN
ncbi:hypothetical protein IJE86_08475 [bacterium]|nr:hypothetical protein [bacterium]